MQSLSTIIFWKLSSAKEFIAIFNSSSLLPISFADTFFLFSCGIQRVSQLNSEYMLYFFFKFHYFRHSLLAFSRTYNYFFQNNRRYQALLKCRGSVVVTACDFESGRPSSNPEWGQYTVRIRSLHWAYPSLHPFGVMHWVPEHLNIKAVTGACKLIDGCSLELCSAIPSVASSAWHIPQK